MDNRDRFEGACRVLREGLTPVIAAILERDMGSRWQDEYEKVRRTRSEERAAHQGRRVQYYPLTRHNDHIDWDIADALEAIDLCWSLFRPSFPQGRASINPIRLLRDARNKWAHARESTDAWFTDRNTIQCLEAMIDVLSALTPGTKLESIRSILHELEDERYQNRVAEKQTTPTYMNPVRSETAPSPKNANSGGISETPYDATHRDMPTDDYYHAPRPDDDRNPMPRQRHRSTNIEQTQGSPYPTFFSCFFLIVIGGAIYPAVLLNGPYSPLINNLLLVALILLSLVIAVVLILLFGSTYTIIEILMPGLLRIGNTSATILITIALACGFISIFLFSTTPFLNAIHTLRLMLFLTMLEASALAAAGLLAYSQLRWWPNANATSVMELLGMKRVGPSGAWTSGLAVLLLVVYLANPYSMPGGLVMLAVMICALLLFFFCLSRFINNCVVQLRERWKAIF